MNKTFVICFSSYFSEIRKKNFSIVVSAFIHPSPPRRGRTTTFYLTSTVSVMDGGDHLPGRDVDVLDGLGAVDHGVGQAVHLIQGGPG